MNAIRAVASVPFKIAEVAFLALVVAVIFGVGGMVRMFEDRQRFRDFG